MGLKSTIQDAVSAAFDAVSDLTVSITRTRTTRGAYSPSGGTYSETTVDTSTTGLISRFTEAEVISSGGTIQRDDLKVIIECTSTLLDLDPTTDTLTIGGNEYQIINVETPEVGGSGLVLKAQVRQ